MTKHQKQPAPTKQGGGAHIDADLRGDPGIGQSKGADMAGEDPTSIKGENSVEGDTPNDANKAGGATPNQMGRTNK